MVKLANEKRPAGKAEDYRFVRNDESGRRFKVKHELRTANDGSPAIAISVAAIGQDHKATSNRLGEPDITYHVHTLTKVELQDPAFDIEARVATMLESTIEAKENELRAVEELSRLSSKWTGDKPLALDRRPA